MDIEDNGKSEDLREEEGKMKKGEREEEKRRGLVRGNNGQ